MLPENTWFLPPPGVALEPVQLLHKIYMVLSEVFRRKQILVREYVREVSKVIKDHETSMSTMSIT